MQKQADITGYSPIGCGMLGAASFGLRAHRLDRLAAAGIATPRALALPACLIHRIAAGAPPPADSLLAAFPRDTLLALRPSPLSPDAGGPRSLLWLGLSPARLDALARDHGRQAAEAVLAGYVIDFAAEVDGIEDDALRPDAPLDAILEAYRQSAGRPFPESPAEQIARALAAMARAWDAPTARLLRAAHGSGDGEGLGLLLQQMHPGALGTGCYRRVDPVTGAAGAGGQMRPGLPVRGGGSGQDLARLPEGMREELGRIAGRARAALGTEVDLSFAADDGAVTVLDAVPLTLSARAMVEVAVALAEDGLISRDEAICRVTPTTLTELLHSQVDRRAERRIVARGVAASPGAATGRVVFSAGAALAHAARGEACILVRRATAPEDIRGMHAASGVLTIQGGMTSHAAVIARGLGRPCVVGVEGVQLDRQRGQLRTEGGCAIAEGDLLTIDGTAGEVLAGEAAMVPPATGAAFDTLLGWAGERADIAVRANADTPEDARAARRFGAAGIGLCRTEHMFFEEDRLGVMREMIFAGSEDARRAALDRLLPMQRADFAELFGIMQGMPVCIRLFDPPLHEFLPETAEGVQALAASLDLPLADVHRRIEALREYNPMLGLRGVRLGVTYPEIYEMQARAIFEATLEAGSHAAPVVPEIMIPLVSARREVELVARRVGAVARDVRRRSGRALDYRLGVMVETPRAALRAGDIAEHSGFLSFGTNDLTQMTYGLSRDDAGRFMGAYVRQGVYPEDPFHTLDVDGVGELLLIAAERAREQEPEIVLAVCGEHGGNPESIAFCRRARFDYVSCSPYRVPLARLAAAQLAIEEPRGAPIY